MKDTHDSALTGVRHVKYAIVTPARDEAKFLSAVIADVFNQTARPARWVIVNDGSLDDTNDVVEQAAAIFPGLTLVSLPRSRARTPGPGVVEAFNTGLRELRIHDFEYIVKLDADVRLPRDYFERIFGVFARREYLGIAGGTCRENGRSIAVWPPYHVRGATKVYRRACFEDIGGLKPLIGWDGIDIISAIANGWETETVAEVCFDHLRPAGSDPSTGGLARSRMRQGQGSYARRALPVSVLLRACRIILQRPVLVGSIALLAGYISARLAGLPRVHDAELIRIQRLIDIRKLVGVTEVQSLARAQRERRKMLVTQV